MNTNIKELRAAQNLTQQDLADRVGVRRETILFLEAGKYNPSLRLAAMISAVFQKPIEEIFVFDEQELKNEKGE